MFNITVSHDSKSNKDILQMDDVSITYKNFGGVGGMYNREGDRNFSIVIPDMETAQELIDMGWKVKIKEPREEGDSPFIHMPVKIKFNGRGPAVYLISGSNRMKLDEDNIGLLDKISIKHIDLDVRPYDWERPDGSSGRTSYLANMWVEQEIDRFYDRFAEGEFPEE